MSTRPFRREREFGLIVGGILALLGCWWFYRHKFIPLAYYFIAGGSLGILFALLIPRALFYPRKAWMSLAEGMSYVMTTLILGIVFFLVVTPIGLIKRFFGWDPLRRRSLGEASYWEPYPVRQRNPKHYEKLY
jgi:hypothetical protein